MIALAWPDTPVKGVGAWYEKVVSVLRIHNKAYFKVGHAALVIVNKEERIYDYYDFGRYETNYGFGRIRSKATDPDLELTTSEGGRIEELLKELSQNISTHGSGKIYAVEISNLSPAKLKSTLFNYSNNRVHPYAPFKPKAINCSRFVHDILVKSLEHSRRKYILKNSPIHILPTGYYIRFLSMVLRSKTIVYNSNQKEGSMETQRNAMLKYKLTEDRYHCLEGIGSSSWFRLLKDTKGNYEIERKNEFGHTTFRSQFSIVGNQDSFKMEKDYSFTYPSDAETCTVLQEGNVFIFKSYKKDQSPKEIPSARAVSIK